MADYLLECNNLRVSEQDFTQQFCVRCANTECSRARPRGSRFDERVATWESRLFLDVPRLNPQDPRYQQAANQPFTEVAPGWGDPYEVQGPKGEVPAEQPPSQEAIVEAPQPEAAAPAQTPQNVPARFQAGGLNTLNQGPIMLGSPAVTPKEQDPWAGPQAAPLVPGERIISPGGRVKFGGSGS